MTAEFCEITKDNGGNRKYRGNMKTAYGVDDLVLKIPAEGHKHVCPSLKETNTDKNAPNLENQYNQKY